MQQEIFLEYSYTTLNEYIKKERIPRRGMYIANALKKEETNVTALLVRNLEKYNTGVELEFQHHEIQLNKDLDNMAFRQKAIIDGLVKAGILQNDGLRWVKKITHTCIRDKKIGITLTIKNI